jgi:hypothetical protein
MAVMNLCYEADMYQLAFNVVSGTPISLRLTREGFETVPEEQLLLGFFGLATAPSTRLQCVTSCRV